MQNLRVAIAGCGKIADAHVEEISKQAGASIVAVCDLEPLMAQQLALRYDLPYYCSGFDQMLDAAKPDVVHIATSPQSHFPLAMRAMAAGCHVFVEKPITPDYQSAAALIDRAVSAHKKLTIGYGYYLDPVSVAMRKLIQTGILGDPIHLESFYGYNLAGPFGPAFLNDANHWLHHLPGKLLHNTIDHLLNKIVEFLPGDEPAIHAFGYCLRPPTACGAGAFPDELRVTLHSEQVSAYATFSAHSRPSAHFLRIYGTKNTAFVDYSSRTLTLEASTKLPGALGRLVLPMQQSWRHAREGLKNFYHFARADFHFFAGLNALIAQFYDSIRYDTPPPIPYRYILKVTAIMDEIFAQLARQSFTALERRSVASDGVAQRLSQRA